MTFLYLFFKRLLVSLAFGIVSISFASATNYVDPANYPGAWPDGSWIAYTVNGVPILDLTTGDATTGGASPSQGGDVAPCTGGSVFFHRDSNNLYFRLCVGADPYSKTGGPLTSSGSWALLIDVTGDGYRDFVVMVDGKSSQNYDATPDNIYVLYKDDLRQDFSDNDIQVGTGGGATIGTAVLWVQDSAGSSNGVDGDNSYTFPNSSPADFERLRISNGPNTGTYYLDIQVPIAALDASSKGGPTLTETTPMAFAFATANSNTNPIQKDFAYPGDFTLDPAEPIPFGDNTSGNETYTQSSFVTLTTSGCGPSTLSSNVIDSLVVNGGGTSATFTSSISSVTFYYQYDSDGNSVPNFSGAWTSIGNAGLAPSTNNPWTLDWDSTTLPPGTYFIKAIAVDDTLNTTDSTDKTDDVGDNSPTGGDTYNPATNETTEIYATYTNSCGSIANYDFGDAPASYSDAAHVIPASPSVYLGTTAPDVESSTQLGSDAGYSATGDDSDGTDDEDGVTFPTLTVGASATIPVSVTQASGNSGYLQGWIDWNGDGSFGAGEQIATDLQSATAGTSTINVEVTVPGIATTDQTFARFRWSTTSGLDSTTAAPDGEVEDYAVTISSAPPVNMCSAAPGGLRFVSDVEADVANGRLPIATGDSTRTYTNVAGTGVDIRLTIYSTSARTETRTIIYIPELNGIRRDFGYEWHPVFEFFETGTTNPANVTDFTVVAEDFEYEIAPATGGEYIENVGIVTSSGTQSLLFETVGGVDVTLGTGGTLDIANGGSTLRAAFPMGPLGNDIGFWTTLDLPNETYSEVFADFGSTSNLNPILGLCSPFAQKNPDRSDSTAAEATHTVVGGLLLGADVDGDPTSIANADASGDGADDDGVTFPTLTQGATATIPVTVTGTGGYLQAWIDWDGNGTFAVGEQIASNSQDGGAGDADSTVNGVIQISTTVPATAVTTQTFARFRWSTTQNLDSTTAASDGEVEDYAVTVAAGGTPFSCTGALYQIASNQSILNEMSFTAVNGGYQVGLNPIASAGQNLNAGYGYNELDDFIYGVRAGTRNLIRVDATGSFDTIATLDASFELGSFAGDILPDGTMIYKVGGANTLQFVDLSDPSNPVNLGTASLGLLSSTGDFAYNPVDQKLYGISYNHNRVFWFDVNSIIPGGGGTIPSGTVITPNFLPNSGYNGNYGAVWFDQDGTMFGYDNVSNEIFIVDTGVNGSGTGTPIVIGTSINEEGNTNDAASCRGPSPIGIDDYSDAPTTGTSYGDAQHEVDFNIYLGAGITVDSANYDSPNADGDANDDGVTFPTLTQGASATIPVSVTQASANNGYLQGWIDWNGDGNFGAGEQVATNLQSATAGTSTINVDVTVPGTATTSQTFARFRWSTTSGLDTTTAASSGEVEDYQLTILESDFGDAPASYDDAKHGVPASPSVYLGTTAPDVESSTQLGSDAGYSATGDDSDGTDDEDGITDDPLVTTDFPILLEGATSYSLDVSCAGAGVVAAWIDFDIDDSFETSERNTNHPVTCASGTATLTWSGLSGLVSGQSYIRVRTATLQSEVDNSTGNASDGEVEDYAITIANQTIDYATPNACVARGGTTTGSNLFSIFDNGTFGFENGLTNQSPVVNPYTGIITGGTYIQFAGGNPDHGEYSFVANAIIERNSSQHPHIIDPIYGMKGRFFASDPNDSTPQMSFTLTGLTPYEFYEYSFWAANSEHSGAPNNVDVIVNGSTIYSTGDLPAVSAALEWKKHSVTFTNGNSTTAEIILKSTEIGSGGNDFYLDNIELLACDVIRDFGDAPASYDDAIHAGPLTPSVYLGSAIPDDENETQLGSDAGASAAGDDSTGTDDEDGISFNTMLLNDATSFTIPAEDITVTNNSGAATTLHAWIDFNNNGAFEPAEYASASVPDGTTTNEPASDLSWTGLTNLTIGDTHARFRLTTTALSDDGGTTTDDRAVGIANDGEVEDYVVTVVPPPFTCSPNFGQVYGNLGSLGIMNLSTQSFDTLGSAGVALNAAGFRPSDGYVYAMGGENLYRLGSDGTTTNLGAIAGLPDGQSANQGDIGPDGHLHIRYGGVATVYRVNVETVSLDGSYTLSPYISDTSDFAYVADRNLFIGVRAFGAQRQIFAFDPSGATQAMGTVNFSDVSFGAAFSDSTGAFFAVNNNDGTLYEFDPDTGESIALGRGTPASRNDGFMCRNSVVVRAVDRSDAPLGYGEASHTIRLGIKLGDLLDGNETSVANADATGDDLDVINDDDGVSSFATLAVNASSYAINATVTNTTGSAATLHGWIDFDGDGSFDTDEHTSVAVADGTNAGTATLNWSSFPGIAAGDSFVRLRLTTEILTSANADGTASDGEVEDYQLEITGFDVSGTVFHDLQPNSIQEPSEDWATGTTVFVNLIDSNNTLFESIEIDPSTNTTGDYLFQAVPPASYSIIITDTAIKTTVVKPTDWVFVEPLTGSRSISVVDQDLSNEDFALFKGSVISGTVFYDDGFNSVLASPYSVLANANNALQDGNEQGISGVSMSLTDGVTSLSTTTNGTGEYRFFVPSSFSSALISHSYGIPTGSSIAGSTVAACLASSFADGAAANQLVGDSDCSAAIDGAEAAFASGQNYSDYDFGVVDRTSLVPDQNSQAASPDTVSYNHLYTPATLGSVALNLDNGRYAYQVFLDSDCDGVIANSEQTDVLTTGFSVGTSWPRDSDNRLAACALELRVIIPAGEPDGRLDIVTLEADLSWQNAASISNANTVTDITTINNGAKLKVTKQVRNLSDSGSFAIRTEGAPGDTLEYCISYTNIGIESLLSTVMTDPIPYFTSFLSDAYDSGAGDQSIQWNAASTSLLTEASDADAGEFANQFVKLDIGTVTAGETGSMCYQVTID